MKLFYSIFLLFSLNAYATVWVFDGVSRDETILKSTGCPADYEQWIILSSTQKQHVQELNVGELDNTGMCYIHYLDENYISATSCPVGTILNTDTNICEVPLDCNATTEYLDTTVIPSVCKPKPNCTDNSTFDLDSVPPSCQCDDHYATYKGLCYPDTSGNGLPDINDPDADLDGDGLPNSQDNDDDGDGIPDEIDQDSPDYNPFAKNSGCDGVDNSTLYKSGSILYSLNDYLYKGIFTSSECNNFLLDDNIDSILFQPDLNTECSKKYCYAHNITSNCTFIPESYKPSPEYIYKNFTASSCDSKVDGVHYSASSFILPDSAKCPSTGFCFLKPIRNNNTPENNQTAPPDLNSTSLDLAPLLKSQNDTNLNLEDIKNKLDDTNLNLEDIKDNTNDLLSTNQDMKQSIDDFSLETGKYQSKSLSQSKLLNDSIGTTNSKLSTLNKKIRDLTGTSGAIASNTAKTANNTKKTADKVTEMVDLMKAEVGLNPDGSVIDGSSAFGGFETDLKNSFNSFTTYDMFGLSNMTGYSIPEFSVQMLGTTVTVFKPSMLNSMPITEMRSLIMFIFALVGFISVFKTI